MKNEIYFNKYAKRGSDYHYKQINKRNPKTFNAFVSARYLKHIFLLKNMLEERNADKSKILKILDAGCGDGVLLFLLQKHLKSYKFDIYGIDLSEVAITTAKTKIPQGNFSVTGVYKTKFDDDFFDIIISSDVIEHINFPDKMLAEIKRIADKKAIILLGTPIRYTGIPLDKMHVKEFFQNEFKELLSVYFNNIAIIETHKLYYFLKYKKTLKFFNLKIGFNRYLFYLLSLVSLNPFLRFQNNKNELCTYMFASSENSK